MTNLDMTVDMLLMFVEGGFVVCSCFYGDIQFIHVY